ncbi:hypothetical protein H920_07416 [Fukomys damarensis]|uniref:Uncharacterized protein n=1 Tax=Fukomys damarensis TaxID=885580 RepID=A0A091DLV6_FUKDA|nr:hypothetical protein H920_07416 [Fukomys damarensis]
MVLSRGQLCVGELIHACHGLIGMGPKVLPHESHGNISFSSETTLFLQYQPSTDRNSGDDCRAEFMEALKSTLYTRGTCPQLPTLGSLLRIPTPAGCRLDMEDAAVPCNNLFPTPSS